jgi:CO/xanthine dehydrogenase Mo-binding subunit
VNLIGQPIKRVDCIYKVTGTAVSICYRSDASALWRYITFPLSHARIVSNRFGAAEALPGVRAVVVGKDLPDLWCRHPGRTIFSLG